jgi:hypothetical protein
MFHPSKKMRMFSINGNFLFDNYQLKISKLILSISIFLKKFLGLLSVGRG